MEWDETHRKDLIIFFQQANMLNLELLDLQGRKGL